MDMAKFRRKAAKGKAKKKCCKDKPRCKSCPVVLKRLEKANAFELDDASLKKALKHARRP